MTVELGPLVAPLRERAADAVLLFDFDGTLSPVVDDPAAAAPRPEVPDLLDRLASQYRRVGVLSGRPVSFLAAALPSSVAVSGLYGLESLVDGAVVDHPDAPRWRPVVADAVRAAEVAAAPGGEIDGATVEPKGLSLTIHVRTRPELAAAVEGLARRLAAETGLEVRPAKMSVELHPPIDADKGAALRSMAEGATAVAYVGDDVGDLPAFDALAALGPDVWTLAVAVGGPELPVEVAQRADVVLPSQAAVVDLLRALVV